MGTDEMALFLALASRDGARFPGLAFDPIPRDTPATVIGERIGVDPAPVLAYCERWVEYGWFNYWEPADSHRASDADKGWVTEVGKIAATYLWGGEAAGSN